MTGAATQVVLDEFRRRYALRHSQRTANHDHETIQIEAEHGLRLLGPAPACNVSIGHPPVSMTDTDTNRYLWVINERGIPYIFEERLVVLCSNVPKHSNLTGGGQAYLGGEMWFASPSKMCVSGGSGRYPPVNRQQLEDAVQVFRSFGYEVEWLGWNDESGMAVRLKEDSS